MKSKEEIEKLAQEWFLNDNSLPYGEEFGFIHGYTQCQEDMGKELEELKDWKRWFFEEQKRADDLRMELEYLKLTTKNK